MMPPNTIDAVLNVYCQGLFPMAESADATGFSWYEAPVRGLLPIETLHVSRRLAQTIKRAPFEIRVDTAFADVMLGCAAETATRQETWINGDIRALFDTLHEAGHAHSVECWRDGALVGGIYGLAVGGLFCGESMFSRERDASKVALVHMAARLWRGGFRLFDTQLVNPHLQQFGVYEMSRDDYLRAIRPVVNLYATFAPGGDAAEEAALIRDYLSKLSLG